MELTENMKGWLDRLYDEAIVEAAQAAENERGWADGSPDAETKEMHLANAAEQDAYAAALTELKDNIQFL